MGSRHTKSYENRNVDNGFIDQLDNKLGNSQSLNSANGESSGEYRVSDCSKDKKLVPILVYPNHSYTKSLHISSIIISKSKIVTKVHNDSSPNQGNDLTTSFKEAKLDHPGVEFQMISRAKHKGVRFSDEVIIHDDLNQFDLSPTNHNDSCLKIPNATFTVMDKNSMRT